MKRKLIETQQEYLITCDNKHCDYVVQNETGEFNSNGIEYVNKPCPKCGNNLLTEDDYKMSLKVLRAVNWINKWFGWLAYIIPNSHHNKKVSVHCHDGIKIKKETE